MLCFSTAMAVAWPEMQHRFCDRLRCRGSAWRRVVLPLPVVLLLLLQLVHFAPPASAQASPTFALGNYVVTQRALDDAPQRYTKFLEEAIAKAEQAKLPDESAGSGKAFSSFFLAAEWRSAKEG